MYGRTAERLRKFIHLIGKAFSQFETWGDIFNPSLYAKPLRREDDIIYCAVEFGEYSKEYHYITDDDTIQEGDTVIVPGWCAKSGDGSDGF